MHETVQNRTQTEIAAIREQLQRILKSDLFAQGGRQSRFLGYIVDATLSGKGKRLNQYLIGLEVFDREESFDPVVDSIVRVEAGRLRSKLTEYYNGPGKKDELIISLPKGGYAVLIETKPEHANDKEPGFVGSKKPYNFIFAAVLFGLILIGIYAGFFMFTKVDTNDSISEVLKTPESSGITETLVQSINREVEKPTIAVLSFDNMSQDPGQEYFSDGITEDIITDLSKISSLFVIARHTSFAYKGKSFDIKDISKELGVRYVLEGSVRKAEEKIRITAQLIDANTGNHIWADRYDRQLNDIFAIQDEVSRKIVNALEINLTGLEKKRLGHRGTSNIEAYDYFLRGQEQFYLFTDKGINNSIDLFSKSIEVDPKYAEAYAWKSRVLVYTFISGRNNSITDTIDPALALARKAIELDELLPVAHANLGWALRWNQEIEEAIVEVTRAVELAPNYADGHLWQSMVLSAAGKGKEALASIEKGIRINPYYSVTYIFSLGSAYFSFGQYEKALYHFNRGIERNPNFIASHIYKIFALELLGKNEEVETATSTLTEIYPDYRLSPAYIYVIGHQSYNNLEK